jgi:hypothetical protein
VRIDPTTLSAAVDDATGLVAVVLSFVTFAFAELSAFPPEPPPHATIHASATANTTRRP